MTDYETFGEWLRRLRRANDLTQEALAERAGCSVATLRSFESGRRRPSRELALILAERLGLPAAEHASFVKRAREHKATHSTNLAGVTPSPPPADASQTRIIIASDPQLRQIQAAESPLIGRAAELAALHDRLSDPTCRLLTITGPGGIGKTRLALQAARETIGAYKHGIRIIFLAGAATPSAAINTIAATLGIMPDESSHLANQIVAAVANQNLMLLLDNLEHLVADDEFAAFLSSLIEESPDIRILATSRIRIGLRSEWVFTLGGLELADRPAYTPSAAALLFAERARRIKQDFAIAPRNETAINQICRLVEGMPLAIELAAAWIAVLTTEEIADEIARNLDLLKIAARDIPERHRSIHAVFERSWSLLNAEEQRVLAALSVFRGGCTREAAEFVAQARLPAIAALLDHSLLRRDGERYILHELIRQYALKRLKTSGAYETTIQRMLDYYRAFIVQAEAMFMGTGAHGWIEQVMRENDNLRAVLREALTRRDIAAGLNFCTGMRFYWSMRGQLREGLDWISQFLQLPGVEKISRARLLGASAPIMRLLGDWERALHTAQSALALYSAGETSGRDDALSGAGLAALDKGDYELARSYLTECLELDRALGNHHFAVSTICNIGHAYFYANQLDAAMQQFHMARELARQSDLTLAEAHACYGIGAVATRQRSLDGALYCVLALPVLARFGYVIVIAHCLETLAAQAGLRGAHLQAGQIHGAAEQLRAMHHLRITPGIRAVYDELAALARGPIGTAAWERALAAGRILSLEQAVALACDIPAAG